MANQNDKNLGGQGHEDEGYGQQAPGRHQDEQSGQKTDDRENTRIGENEDTEE